MRGGLRPLRLARATSDRSRRPVHVQVCHLSKKLLRTAGLGHPAPALARAGGRRRVYTQPRPEADLSSRSMHGTLSNAPRRWRSTAPCMAGPIDHWLRHGRLASDSRCQAKRAENSIREKHTLRSPWPGTDRRVPDEVVSGGEPAACRARKGQGGTPASRTTGPVQGGSDCRRPNAAGNAGCRASASS